MIWVEGPSDRIYLNHWLRHKAPELREGIEYSIMFYGGKLLSHVSTVDLAEELVREFIELRRLNRNIVMLIDSDKESPESLIRDTKLRLKAELENDSRGFIWITEGREVENYLDPDLLEAAVQKAHPSSDVRPAKSSKFDQISVRSKKESAGTKFKPYGKVPTAEVFIELDSKPDFERLDLGAKLKALVEFIKKANSVG